MSEILITGGTGYIGSHTVVALIDAGYKPVIADNLSNSNIGVLKRIAKITGYKPPFYKTDIRNTAGLVSVLKKHKISTVIHFAGLKAVGEAVAEPLRYYENNIYGTLSFCRAMTERGIKKIIFSSSASIYGNASVMPVKENAPASPQNPYATTKLMVEQILQDIYIADPAWRVILLRYFNPVGAHQSGLIGEDPRGIPNNLMPFISQVAVGLRKFLRVYGNDYPTNDGTGIRDYIHVMDLAEGHVAALKKMEKAVSGKTAKRPLIINLGTGRGYSVIEIIEAFEKASGIKIPYKIVKRRPGDIATCWADTGLAKRLLGWKAKRDLAQMCSDAWRWQSQNSNGYN